MPRTSPCSKWLGRASSDSGTRTKRGIASHEKPSASTRSRPWGNAASAASSRGPASRSESRRVKEAICCCEITATASAPDSYRRYESLPGRSAANPCEVCLIAPTARPRALRAGIRDSRSDVLPLPERPTRPTTPGAPWLSTSSLFRRIAATAAPRSSRTSPPRIPGTGSSGATLHSRRGDRRGSMTPVISAAGARPVGCAADPQENG